jgi:hypothetical protein
MAIVAALLPACKAGKGSTPTASAEPSSSAVGTGLPSTVPSLAERPAPSAPPDVGERVLPMAKACRAIQVKGTVTDEAGKVISTSAAVDGTGWLDMGDKVTLAVEHILTTREVVFIGPGRVLPCVAGEERFYLVRGGARTSIGSGSRPGAEVLVATPYGAVRYGDARLEIKVGSGTVDVRSDAGDAWFESSNADGSSIADEKIPAGKLLSRKGLSVDVKALLGTCEAAAKTAEARARAVLNPGATDRATPLGTRAADHVRARRAARFACDIARAALGTLQNGDRDAMSQALGSSEARFRGLPEKAESAEKTESR